MQTAPRNGTVSRYNPAAESDPLIRVHVTEDPDTGEAVFRGTHYPVWSVVLNLRATAYDWNRVQQMFPELSRTALEAAERFWQRHPDDIRSFVEEPSA